MRHVVIATIARQHYAIPTSHVVEVIPVVRARPLAAAPAWVLGSINYRGQLIPALDLARLLGAETCRAGMANRVVVVRQKDASGGSESLLGVLVEAILGSDSVDFSDSASHARLGPRSAEFLSEVTLGDYGALQCIDPARLPRPFEETPPEAGSVGS